MIKNTASGILITALVILPFAAASSLAAPLGAVSTTAGELGRGITLRIDDAFALTMVNADAGGAAGVILPLKGNSPRPGNCVGAAWPNINASCLSTADGSPAPLVRTIAMDYQTGINTTTLIRSPGPAATHR